MSPVCACATPPQTCARTHSHMRAPYVECRRRSLGCWRCSSSHGVRDQCGRDLAVQLRPSRPSSALQALSFLALRTPVAARGKRSACPSPMRASSRRPSQDDRTAAKCRSKTSCRRAVCCSPRAAACTTTTQQFGPLTTPRSPCASVRLTFISEGDNINKWIYIYRKIDAHEHAHTYVGMYLRISICLYLHVYKSVYT